MQGQYLPPCASSVAHVEHEITNAHPRIGTRNTTIVALARKLLIALWTSEVPEGRRLGLFVGEADGPNQGFLLDQGRGFRREGVFTAIDHPDSGTAPGTGTAAVGIDNRGQIVGIYANPDAAPDDQPSPMRVPMMLVGR
jgi:hypothetical protein